MAAKKNSQNTETVDSPRLDEETQERLRRMGYVPVGGGMGEIQKWEIGRKVEGRFCGVRKGKMGYLFDVEVKPGEVEVYGCPKALEPRLTPLPLGSQIYVECVGTKKSDYPNDMWLFEVFAKPAETK